MRVAVSGIFALNGLLASMWVAHIPVIQDRTGVDNATLGGLLLLLGASAFVGMQLLGPLIDRFGSRGPTVISAIALAVAIVLPGLATGPITLAAAMVMFGFCNGALDVSMNTQAVLIERIYGRPIMSSIHGFFSIGGLIGSGVVAATLAVDVPLLATLGTCCALAICCALLLSNTLITGYADEEPGEPGETENAAASRRPWGRIALLAAVAFGLMLAEGTAYDWSALYLVERYDQPEAIGAIAFGAFSATMVVGRFSADTVSARLGPVAVVRLGSAIAMVGMTLVICSPTPVLSVIGWAIFGLGVAGGVPQLFTAAGNISSRSSGQTISLVVGCGYVGMLAGPAVIGPVSSWFSLGTALWIAAAGMAFAFVAAPVVRPRAGDAGSAQKPASAAGERGRTGAPHGL
ncbi:putative MFS family arabinose efflux permease [Williamsia muralis]|nr:MFS transporter [Williamsia marianensis]PVY33055.1 putative MFS family arabinose efflux permease [Williamsia marianensis]